jgi:hypothetical protein
MNHGYLKVGYQVAKSSVFSGDELRSKSLTPGQDISDAQYFIFRRNLPYLAGLLIFHPLFRKLYNAVRPIPTGIGSPRSNGSSYVSAAEGDARLEQRASFDFGFALLFMSALHGFSVFKILIILYANHRMVTSTSIPRAYLPAATWIFNIGVLFANELSDGYQFAKMASFFWPIEQGGSIFVWARWLDRYCGIMPRWHINFNMTVLRLISFNLDYYWSLNMRGSSALEV